MPSWEVVSRLSRVDGTWPGLVSRDDSIWVQSAFGTIKRKWPLQRVSTDISCLGFS